MYRKFVALKMVLEFAEHFCNVDISLAVCEGSKPHLLRSGLLQFAWSDLPEPTEL